ncbi:MAG: caspase family protein [Planctomycetaceae bacterium]|nr:caspase family protein [Planctomycetaceae bacterium]
MRTSVLLVFISALTGSPACGLAFDKGVQVEPVETPEESWALLIGLNYYHDPDVSSLHFAADDAKLLKEVLIDGGFPADHVTVIADDSATPQHVVTRDDLKQQLRSICERADVNDTLVVFFSGHGFMDRDGAGYLAPQNCQRNNLAETCLPLSDVDEILTTCRAANKLLLLDCCRNDPAKGTDNTSGDVTAIFRRNKELLTIASCQREQKSFESVELKHGYFSWYVAEALQGYADQDADQLIDTNELYTYACQHVREITAEVKLQQIPEEIRQETRSVFSVVTIPPSPSVIRLAEKKPAVAVTTDPASGSGTSFWWFLTAVPVFLLAGWIMLRPRRRMRKVISGGGRRRSQVVDD